MGYRPVNRNPGVPPSRIPPKGGGGQGGPPAQPHGFAHGLRRARVAGLTDARVAGINDPRIPTYTRNLVAREAARWASPADYLDHAAKVAESGRFGYDPRVVQLLSVAADLSRRDGLGANAAIDQAAQFTEEAETYSGPRPEPLEDWGSNEWLGGPTPREELAALRARLPHRAGSRIATVGAVLFWLLALGLFIKLWPLFLLLAVVGGGTAVVVGRRRYRRERQAEMVRRAEEQNQRWMEGGHLW